MIFRISFAEFMKINVFRGKKKIKFWMQSMNKYEKTFDLQFLIPHPDLLKNTHLRLHSMKF